MKSAIKLIKLLLKDSSRSIKRKNWHLRWCEACDGLWQKFELKPRTEETLKWAERNHGRLMALCKKKYHV